jgi:hypothetical protein
MTEILVQKSSITGNDPRKLARIRDRFREIFGHDITLNDEALVQRYSVTPDDDLIVILR